MRLIDADELNKVKFHELPYTHITPADLPKLQTEAYERGWNDAIDAIVESADTIDAVPVIRCVDCVHIECDEGATWCTHPRWVQLDGYCANGERKAEP